VDGGGHIRPHWRALIGTLSALSPGALQERRARLERAFEEEGVATVLASQAAGGTPPHRPWRCDLMPLVLPAAEFAALEQALAARAELHEAVLQDLYGPQHLLEQGVVPASLVFGSPFFLRACRAPALPPGPRLHLYAADLLRGSDGAWRVVADRCGGPNGIGFARENRLLLSRTLPEAFRSVQLRPLRHFFETWLDALQRLAPAGADNPRIALLTGGPRQETWLEHLFLSRELGLDLVEAADLTVRDGAVFLKTLRGLQRLDVVLRRIKGRDCDPLELGGAADAGVPGLLHAVRAGSLRLVNDPGAMLAEAPGLAPYLSACAATLGLPPPAPAALETIWLGDPAALALWRAAPEAWQLRSAHDPGAVPDAAAVAARPGAYAATRPMMPSAAPVLGAEGLEPAPVLLRLFLARDGTGAWRAMPGGLARVIGEGGPIGHLPSQRSMAKDVWVLAEDSGDLQGPQVLRPGPLAIRRSSGELPSRIADDLYWLGRYLERLEGAARLLRAMLARLQRGMALPREHEEARALAQCLHAAALLDEESAATPPDGTALPRALLAAMGAGGPLAMLLDQVERLHMAVRDRLTMDMWGTLASLAQDGRARLANLPAGGMEAAGEAATAMIRGCTAVAGMAAENMVRGGAWMFLDLGRRIERASGTACSLAHALERPPGRMEAGLRLALELCDSALTYRARYLAAMQAPPALDLVLADPGNPRALAYQLRAVAERLAELGGAGDPLAGEAAALASRPQALVEAIAEVPDPEHWAAEALPAALGELAGEVAALSDAISRRYVSHIRPRALGDEG
jgi:uncharacterized circularly permuted ATP-grasp superfamily protein/uncharacterized alpha-E superfamily protein